jgi:hypothetical protein
MRFISVSRKLRRNEILQLIGKDDMAAAEHAFFAILYDIPKECDAPSFLRLAHVGVDTLEKAAELVADTDSDQAAIYRAGNAVSGMPCGPHKRVRNGPFGSPAVRG